MQLMAAGRAIGSARVQRDVAEARSPAGPIERGDDHRVSCLHERGPIRHRAPLGELTERSGGGAVLAARTRDSSLSPAPARAGPNGWRRGTCAAVGGNCSRERTAVVCVQKSNWRRGHARAPIQDQRGANDRNYPAREACERGINRAGAHHD